MNEENEYVGQLTAARAREVEHRRNIAKGLSKPYQRGLENWRSDFIAVQTTIEAIDRALADERAVAAGSKPPVYLPPILGPLPGKSGFDNDR
jgi:hypothetical protein